MKTNIVWSIVWGIVIVAMLLVFALPSWANAQDGARDKTPDPLQPYKDWLFGVLSQGVRVTGGSECRDVDGAQACSFDFTLSWAESE